MQARGVGARLGESGSRAEEREVHPMDRMVVALQSDHTHYAIAKTSGMCAAIRESYEVRMFGKNESTQRQQAGHWRRWTSFCGAQGICATRDDHEANSGRDRVGYAREVELLNSALCFYMGIAKGRGRPAALPKTGMNWLRAIRRVHEQMMPRVDMIPMKAVEDCYNGLMRQYQLKWTVAATLPRRKEPLTNADIARLTDLWWNPINSGKKLGRLTIEVGSLATTMIGCLWLLLLDSGMRLAELTSNRWDVTRCSRASLSFKIGGVLYRAPSRVKLLGMREGDYAIVTPPPSKKDQHGAVWGCKPIWLDYRDEVGCSARALKELELAFPIKELDRPNTPLFVDSEGRCIRSDRARSLFKKSLETFKSKESVKKFSTHSFRITLACKLKAARCPDTTILAICRWQSMKSLVVYCRLTPGEYTSILKKARRADAKSIQVTSLPDIGADEEGELSDEEEEATEE